MMKACELSIAGAWMFEPTVFPDARGMFAAPFQGAAFPDAIGFDLTVAQTNHSVSARGVLRGVHFADTPPGQAKYVYCPCGALLDVIIDVRVGSPTFGAFKAVELDDRSCRAVYLVEGLGHAFVALADDTVMAYLCSTPYNPSAEHGVSPLSEKDAAAPTLAEAEERKLLPTFDACAAWYERQRRPFPGPPSHVKSPFDRLEPRSPRRSRGARHSGEGGGAEHGDRPGPC